MSSLNNLLINPCQCDENTTFDIDASEGLARKLNVNIDFFNLHSNTLQSVDVTVYSENHVPLASSSFTMKIPMNTTCISKKITLLLPCENICELSKYNVVILCNAVC
jgi:hypothetical protein